MHIFKRGMSLLLLSVSLLSTTGCKQNSADGGKPTVAAKQVFPDPIAGPVAQAIADDDTVRLQALLKAGANPSAVGERETSLLQWALLNKSKPSLEALLAAGADTTHSDAKGDTVMHYAAEATDPAYLNVLLAHKVDPNGPNAVDGTTPLMGAMSYGREAQFRALLAAGANPNLTDHVGNTALHVAAQLNASGFAIALLDAHADPLTKNRQGFTFQRYLYMTPTKILTEDTRRQREGVVAWLRSHNVAVEDAPTSPGDAGAN